MVSSSDPSQEWIWIGNCPGDAVLIATAQGSAIDFGDDGDPLLLQNMN